jgi:hypothetical protein
MNPNASVPPEEHGRRRVPHQLNEDAVKATTAPATEKEADSKVTPAKRREQE